MGGAILLKNYSDYKILLSLRAHGWDREINKKKVGVFKINQKNWQDIGQLQEYKKKVNLLI